MSEPRGPSQAGLLATLGVVVVAVLCCAGPALLAGGALAGLGGLLRNPWLIGVGAVIVVTAISLAMRRRRRAAGTTTAEGCTSQGRPDSPEQMPMR
ncbi:MAG TPA: hypothetical protein VFT67_07650 [Jatrophihabitantaceae bacterium]|nr:hypothetical protein [Jatrophihabitantaceae bacterium]